MSKNYGIKLAPPGSNVGDLDDTDELWFNSEFPFLKLHDSDTFNLIFDKVGNGDVTISHTLGYTPFAIVLMKRYVDGSLSDGYYLLDWSYIGATTSGFQHAAVNDEELYIEYHDPAEADSILHSIPGKYFIFDFDLSTCATI